MKNFLYKQLVVCILVSTLSFSPTAFAAAGFNKIPEFYGPIDPVQNYLLAKDIAGYELNGKKNPLKKSVVKAYANISKEWFYATATVVGNFLYVSGTSKGIVSLGADEVSFNFDGSTTKNNVSSGPFYNYVYRINLKNGTKKLILKEKIEEQDEILGLMGSDGDSLIFYRGNFVDESELVITDYCHDGLNLDTYIALNTTSKKVNLSTYSMSKEIRDASKKKTDKCLLEENP